MTSFLTLPSPLPQSSSISKSSHIHLQNKIQNLITSHDSHSHQSTKMLLCKRKKKVHFHSLPLANIVSSVSLFWSQNTLEKSVLAYASKSPLVNSIPTHQMLPWLLPQLLWPYFLSLCKNYILNVYVFVFFFIPLNVSTLSRLWSAQSLAQAHHMVAINKNLLHYWMNDL